MGWFRREKYMDENKKHVNLQGRFIYLSLIFIFYSTTINWGDFQLTKQ